MSRKKKDEVEETVSVGEEVAAPDVAAETPNVEAAAEEVAAAPAEESVIEAAPAVAEKPKKAAKSAPKAKEPANADESAAAVLQKISKRAEKIGIVSSDKMTKTVTVRVDRLVKHPIYRKYVKKRKKFMAHDEMGAKIGDKVKIVETRPLSARKRWRVVEILHKAEL